MTSTNNRSRGFGNHAEGVAPSPPKKNNWYIENRLLLREFESTPHYKALRNLRNLFKYYKWGKFSLDDEVKERLLTIYSQIDLVCDEKKKNLYENFQISLIKQNEHFQKKKRWLLK